MMRQMRENTKWIMLMTAFAFVALMVFEWGMDITGRSGSGGGVLGRVNGVPVTYEVYQATYRNMSDQLSRSQEEPLNSAQIAELEDAAWDEVVNQILISQELSRRGIEVTDEEILQAAQFSPPQELMGDPLFQTEGRFDIQKYQDFLANAADQLFLLQLDAYYRDIIPRSKLMRQVTSGIYFSDAELWSEYQSANERVRVRFLAMNPVSRVADEDVAVSDQEIEAYFRANQEDFQVPAKAEVKYVVLNKAPLPEDTAASLERARSARQEIQDGVDFAEVAARESSDQATAGEGGDLGSFTRGQMVPAFDSLVFSAPLNRVMEPIQTNFGLHVVEVLGRQGDTAQARHILIPIERTNESELALLTLADSLEVLGENMTIDEAANSLGQVVRTQEMTELFPFLAGAGQISDGLEWVFEEGVPGEVSPVFEDQQAFYMMELVSGEPGGIQTLEQAGPSIRQILLIERKIEEAKAEAAGLIENARAAGTLEVLDNGDDLVVQEPEPFTRNEFVPGLGRQNAAVGVAFGLEVGSISDPVEAQNNLFLIQTLERIPADSTAWAEQMATQRTQLGFAVQQQRLQQWIAGLREVADIVDRREEVFEASAQAAQSAPMGGLF
jgi:parvulin-like peptidyl-prolyl isomerase